MLLTENEAKRTVCQETLVRETISDARCIGAACMAWRWGPPQSQRMRVRCDNLDNPEYGDPHWCVECEGTKTVSETRSERVGYCGKAGIPQL